MNITFKKKKLEKICNSRKLVQKEFGKIMGDRLMQRLEELSACENLEIMNYLPQARCQLIQDRKGQLSVDLEHPYRLIFIPEPPFSSLSAGGLDRSSVKKIKIISVEDTHDKKRKK